VKSNLEVLKLQGTNQSGQLGKAIGVYRNRMSAVVFYEFEEGYLTEKHSDAKGPTTRTGMPMGKGGG